jgi:hypothetical protein
MPPQQRSRSRALQAKRAEQQKNTPASSGKCRSDEIHKARPAKTAYQEDLPKGAGQHL